MLQAGFEKPVYELPTGLTKEERIKLQKDMENFYQVRDTHEFSGDIFGKPVSTLGTVVTIGSINYIKA